VPGPMRSALVGRSRCRVMRSGRRSRRCANRTARRAAAARTRTRRRIRGGGPPSQREKVRRRTRMAPSNLLDRSACCGPACATTGFTPRSDGRSGAPFTTFLHSFSALRVLRLSPSRGRSSLFCSWRGCPVAEERAIVAPPEARTTQITALLLREAVVERPLWQSSAVTPSGAATCPRPGGGMAATIASTPAPSAPADAPPSGLVCHVPLGRPKRRPCARPAGASRRRARARGGARRVQGVEGGGSIPEF